MTSGCGASSRSRNYGDHLQFSVFKCDLAPVEKIEFERKLAEVMKLDEDQALFVARGPSEGRGVRERSDGDMATRHLTRVAAEALATRQRARSR